MTASAPYWTSRKRPKSKGRRGCRGQHQWVVRGSIKICSKCGQYR